MSSTSLIVVLQLLSSCLLSHRQFNFLPLSQSATRHNARRWCNGIQGEYIAPEKLEGVFARAPLAAQVFVYGDSLKAQLVAVVVPDPDVLLPWASERGMAKDLATLCGDAAVAAAVLRSMQSEGQAAQLKGFEQVGLLYPSLFCISLAL